MARDLTDRDIAVIGVAVHVPGADRKDTYWANLSAGVDSTGSFPKARELELESYVKVLDCGDVTYKRGGYLNDISSFDYKYFKIPKSEANLIQPDQRLFLESALTAMEDAGYGGNRWYGKNIGVFVGYIGTMEITGYPNISKVMGADASPTALFSSGIAGRLSYFMNFTGESVMVDSACSSSFAALKYACNALKLKECDGAVVGGVQLSVFPDEKEYSIGIESSDGHTRPFDSEADGTGVSEGVCSVIIKRLPDAVRDGDHIYGVIRAVQSNQDGRSLGLSAPNPKAQTELFFRTCQKLNLDPGDISYLELHGTGTKLGDSIEIQALTRSLEEMELPAGTKIPVGSVKANIGHTFSCSGLAGLIKCCLMIENRKLCPQINCDAPLYEERADRFRINRELTDFPETGPEFTCCISNYGLSGTNYLCILSEYADKKHLEQKERDTELFVLSAMTESALRRQTEEMVSFLLKEKTVDLTDLCYTASVGRGHYQYRLAILCETAEELKMSLANFRFCSEPEHNVFYSCVRKLTDPRQKIKFGELNQESFSRLNQKVGVLINSVLQSDSTDAEVKKQIAFCYTSGADIDWDTLYGSRCASVVSMPTYSFDKTRCWMA